MIPQWFKNRARRRQSAKRLYQLALAQSREPVFYRDLEVADTMDGRFDLVCFHVALLLNRFKDFGAEGGRQAQALFDHMFKQMELTLREIGVGDLGVPKHMQKMMKAFNGRAQAYETAFAKRDAEALHLAVFRNIYRIDDASCAHAAAQSLSDYGMACTDVLREYSLAQMEAGEISFAPLPVRLEKKERLHA